ncbi:hypothetical protein GP486_004270 [Trichoglossum hirsutum]|uniref:ubiquitinyl hydrolase 1 n=1 Tax=Trichoglossum hirsutum TaxID=265104 RepID=A0A9P8RPE3_9PEZI|nr:hypothetical protein GP486_004270 [Trichoglossum hirsutum]
MSYWDHQPLSSFRHPTYQKISHIDDTASKLSSTTALSYVALSVALGYFTLLYMQLLSASPLGVIWRFLVYIIPSRLIFLLDSFISSSRGMQSGGAAEPTGHAAKDQALRRILGLDGVGILGKLNLTRNGPGFSAVVKDVHEGAPPGLGNWDNSCYQNSVIQALASLRSLTDYLTAALSDPYINWKSPKSKSMTMRALLDTIEKLNDPLNEGRRFWTPSELKQMRSWQQQDAQEYLSKVLDEIDNELLRAVKGSNLDYGLKSHDMSGPRLRKSLPPQCQIEQEVAEQEEVTSDVSKVSSVSSHSVFMARDSTVSPLSLILPRNPVEGLVAQRVGCLQCGFSEGLSLIPFNCITVPLGGDWLYDLRDCLDEYTSLEMIDGVECANCTLLKSKAQLEQLLDRLPSPAASSDSSETCTEERPLQEMPASSRSSLPDQVRNSALSRLEAITAALEEENFSESTLKNTCKIPPRNRVTTTKTRQAVIARAPRCLIIHINRSVFDEFSGIQRKNYAKVQFQPILDLGYWCLGQRIAEGESGEPIEEWEMGPGKSMLQSSISPVLSEIGPLYELRSVITHFGRHENGHYICYRKLNYPPISGERNGLPMEGVVSKPIERWWRISDDDVMPVSEEYVLDQGGAFMLFYEQTNVEDISSADSSLETPPLHCPSLEEEVSAKEPGGIVNDSAIVPRPTVDTENWPSFSEDDSSPDDSTLSPFSADSPESTATSNTDGQSEPNSEPTVPPVSDLLDSLVSYQNGTLGDILEPVKGRATTPPAGQHPSLPPGPQSEDGQLTIEVNRTALYGALDEE